MTPELLRAAIGCTPAAARRFAAPLSAGLAFYDINMPMRLPMFLAQLGHETQSLRYMAEVWGPTEAQEGYEGREDLGNTQPGDGERFKGHGGFQVTGRANHVRVRDRLRKRFLDVPDFELEPEALCEPQWAMLSACDYWDDRRLNALADKVRFDEVTRRINGGQNGRADRRIRWMKALDALDGT